MPHRVTVRHQKSSDTTRPRADFFICATGAKNLLEQAQTYSTTAQDISVFCDRGHVVVIIANYTQLWHSSEKFLILKIHLEKDLALFFFLQESVWSGQFSGNENMKPTYPQLWGKIWEVFQILVSAFNAISVSDQEEGNVLHVESHSVELHMHEPDNGKQNCHQQRYSGSPDPWNMRPAVLVAEDARRHHWTLML